MSDVVQSDSSPPADESFVSFERLLHLERLELNSRRKLLGHSLLSETPDAGGNEAIVGLALSGGGIRAAALSLGAMEALSEVAIATPGGSESSTAFDGIDYVSSVSGGGYAACSISAKIAADGRTSLVPNKDAAAHEYISFIRTHSKLLDDYFEILTNWMYSFLVGVLTILPFLFIVAAVQIALFRNDGALASMASSAGNYATYLIVAAIAVYFIFAVISSSRFGGGGTLVPYLWKILAVFIVGGFFIVSQPALIQANLPNGWFYSLSDSSVLLRSIFNTRAQEVLIPALLLLLLAAVLISLMLRREQFLKNSGSASRAALVGAAIQLCLAAIFVVAPSLIWGMVVMLSRWGIICNVCSWNAANHSSPEWVASVVRHINRWLMPIYNFFGQEARFKEITMPNQDTGIVPAFSFSIVYVLLAITLFIVMKYVVDSNASSFHRFYSRRLRNCFFYREKGGPVPAISALRGTVCPYLLVNCSVNAVVRESGVWKAVDEPFVVASRYTGNNSLGYVRTDLLEGAAGAGLDLAGVAAISGAVFSPVMGRYTIPSFRLLMSMLALRLGYWIPSPSEVAALASTTQAAGRRVDGLYFLREMFGLLRADARFLYITDGGHTENSGIYELLRRRCSTIVAIDAEPDTDRLFENIAYLIEFARVRLNTEISLSCRTVGIDGGTHCAIGEVRYPAKDGQSAFVATLLYFKLSLTGDENWDLISRKQASGGFPYHSTLNQNYDELLFNAYRILGIHMVSRVFSGVDRVEFWTGDVRTLSAGEIKQLF